MVLRMHKVQDMRRPVHFQRRGHEELSQVRTQHFYSTKILLMKSLRPRSVGIIPVKVVENLFPTEDTLLGKTGSLPLKEKPEDIDLFNESIRENKEQLSAVFHILNGTSFPVPYIVFGPPGTGKTVTVVEAIKQVWNEMPRSRIVVAAPSNTAADLLVTISKSVVGYL